MGHARALAIAPAAARIRRARSRHVEQVNRFFKECVLGDFNVGAVLHESRVEGDEGVLLVRGVTGQVLLEQLGTTCQRGGQASCLDSRRQGFKFRKLGTQRAVQKHKSTTPQVRQRRALDLCCQEGVELVFGRLEGKPRDRGHARELPFLVLRGGESELREAVHRSVANRAEPSRLLAGKPLFETLETREVNVLVFFDGDHGFEIPWSGVGWASAARAAASEPLAQFTLAALPPQIPPAIRSPSLRGPAPGLSRRT